MIIKTNKLEKSMICEIREALNNQVSRKELLEIFKEYSSLIENRIERKKPYNQQAFGALRNMVIDYWK